MKKYLNLLAVLVSPIIVRAKGRVYDMPGYGDGDFGWFWAMVAIGIILYFVFSDKKE